MPQPMFGNGAAPAGQPAQPATPHTQPMQAPAQAPKQAMSFAAPVGHTHSAAPTTPPPSFMMTGQAAQAALAEEEARAQAARDEAGKKWRHYISKKNIGVQYPLIFVSGRLEPDGTLKQICWYEHTVSMKGRPHYFPCVAHEGPCPLCTAQNQQDLVFALTVIDPTPRTIQSGTKQGQVIPHTQKLFVCKKRTFAQLQVLATTYGADGSGIFGMQFNVSRAQQMSAGVGDVFIPVARWSPEELVATYGDDAKEADYMNEIVYRNAQQLVELGVVEAVPMQKVPGASASLKNEL